MASNTAKWPKPCTRNRLIERITATLKILRLRRRNEDFWRTSLSVAVLVHSNVCARKHLSVSSVFLFFLVEGGFRLEELVKQKELLTCHQCKTVVTLFAYVCHFHVFSAFHRWHNISRADACIIWKMFEMCALSKFRPPARYKVFSWRHFEWNRRGDVESQALAAPCSAGLNPPIAWKWIWLNSAESFDNGRWCWFVDIFKWHACWTCLWWYIASASKVGGLRV